VASPPVPLAALCVCVCVYVCVVLGITKGRQRYVQHAHTLLLGKKLHAPSVVSLVSAVHDNINECVLVDDLR